MPNADPDGWIIIKMIDEFIFAHSDRAFFFISMSYQNYLSTMQFVDGVVGNSSSGLLEAPTFRIGAVDIGDRQKSRLKAEKVIDCEPREMQ